MCVSPPSPSPCSRRIADCGISVQAARGQEGVYVSKETWDEMETGRLSFDETKRKLEISESQLQTTRDQFEQNFRLLSLREEQLRKAKDELGVVKGELAATSAELAETRLRLAQQEVLRDAFETSREGWKEAAGGALDDVEGLRAKLGAHCASLFSSSCELTAHHHRAQVGRRAQQSFAHRRRTGSHRDPRGTDRRMHGGAPFDPAGLSR